MKLSIKEGSENYSASVVVINQIYDVINADKLKKTIIHGNTILISNEIKENDLMVYFTAGTQISEQYAFENNLNADSSKNKDDTKKGYLTNKRIVKCIKLRGEISNGFLMPIESFNYIKNIDLKLKDEFTDINEYNICQKYFNYKLVDKKLKVNKQKLDLLLENHFSFHTNTEHFAKNLSLFSKDDIITITRKRHGSSGIVSNCLIKKPFKWYEKIINFFYKLPITEYGFVYSSGKPKSRIPKGIVSVSSDWTTSNNSYYSTDIWKHSFEILKDKIEKGISLYFEITGVGIQGNEYTYNREFAIHVYKITTTNVDGDIIELGWNEVKNYCEKYNIEYCEEYYHGKLKDWCYSVGVSPDFWIESNYLNLLSKEYLNKSYKDCKVDEGIVITNNTTNIKYKLKSPKFILNESNALENIMTNED